MTAAQQASVKQVALRFGCWPDDIRWDSDGEDVVVVIGERKGRPKTLVVTATGRTRTRGERDG